MTVQVANSEQNIQEEVHNVKIKDQKIYLLNTEDTKQSKNQRNSTFHFLWYKNKQSICFY